MKVVFLLILLTGVVSAAPTNSSPIEKYWKSTSDFQASLDWLNGALDELDGDLIPSEFVFFMRSLTVDDLDAANVAFAEWENSKKFAREFTRLMKENKGKFNGSDAEIEAAWKALQNDAKFQKLNDDWSWAGHRFRTNFEKFTNLNTRFNDAAGAYMFKFMILRSWNDTSPAYALLRSLSASSNDLHLEYLVAKTYLTFSKSTKQIVDVFINKFTTNVACRKTALEECENKKTWMEPSEATQEEVDAAIAECQAQSKPKCKKWTLGTSMMQDFFGFLGF